MSPYVPNNFNNSSPHPNAGTFLTIKYLEHKFQMKTVLINEGMHHVFSILTKTTDQQEFTKLLCKFNVICTSKSAQTSSQKKKKQFNSKRNTKNKKKRTHLDSSQTVYTRTAGRSSLLRGITTPKATQKGTI